MSSVGSGGPMHGGGAQEVTLLEIEAKKQRKRVQNRMNQRARRMRTGQRIKDKEARDPKLALRPYRVDRWRIKDHNASQIEAASSNYADESADLIIADQTRGREPDTITTADQLNKASEIFFPLPSDCMLHLIQQNVGRALRSNKSILNRLAKLTILDGYLESPIIGRPTLCGGVYSIIHPVDPRIPNALFPTSVQMVHPHSNWIDMFPFPNIRDNLIQHFGSYDHWELLEDVFGSLLVNNLSNKPKTQTLTSNSKTSLQDEDEDVITAGLEGFIVWGEPHEKQSWEVTPGFCKKWSWVLDGCEELIRISNNWRKSRGEDPMRVLAVY